MRVEYNVITGQKLVYAPDQLGSVRDALDATTGTRVASYDYTPYGAVARSNVTNGTDYQYGGLYKHVQSGLNMGTFRVIDPITGRWLNRDPIREDGGLNLYSYVEANPVNGVDPNGLQIAVIIPGRPPLTIPPGVKFPHLPSSSLTPSQTLEFYKDMYGGAMDMILCMAKPTGKDKSTDYPSWVNDYGRDPGRRL